MIVEPLLWTFAGLLIAVAMIAIGILCTPVCISVVFDTDARPSFLVKVALVGGLLPPISTTGRQHGRSIKRPKQATAPRPRKAKPAKAIAFAPRMLREVPGLISSIASRVKLERANAEIRFGLSDPADTGMVYGMLIPVLQFLTISERTNIALHPDFGDQVVDGRGRVGIRFVPLAIVVPMLGFAWAAVVMPRLSGAFR